MMPVSLPAHAHKKKSLHQLYRSMPPRKQVSAYFQFIMYLKGILHIVIHNSIRLDNYKRNDLFTDQDTGHAAACRCQERIIQIFGSNI